MATYELVNADQLDADLTAIGNAIRAKGETTGSLAFPNEMVEAIGAISTGVELNFEVVGGTTQPTNPKENTIWVSTSEKITSWIFVSDAPAEPEEGMVWFTTGASSQFAFNALKKNAIQVYPISVKQYINGAWAEVTAMSYRSGAWVRWWNGELYDTGNQYQSITGGWKSVGENGSPAKRITFGASSISFATKSAAEAATVYTENVIDLTRFSKMKVELNVTAVNTTVSNTVSIGIASVNTSSVGSSKAIDKKNSKATGSMTLECPISADNGYPYVCSDESNFTVTKIWLE